MSWRIDKIIFENFKIFKDSFTFSLEGRHLLLFGENGSGKSSLNWGLYTFLQSVLKMPNLAEAQKYFTAGHDQNLRNRFSAAHDYSGIQIEFINDANVRLTLEDSITRVNTANPASPLSIRYSLSASDFLNYKYLISLFDFRNSDTNDIFSILFHEVFPLDDLSTSVKDIYGNAIGKNIKLWWDTLNAILPSLPRGIDRQQNHILRSGQPWTDFTNQLATFNSNLNLFLQSLEMRANNILASKFKIPAEIKFEYRDAIWERQSPTPANGDLRLVPPQILLTAEYTHPSATDKKILHPRSFFNEATLSKMAIALRFAITDNRVANAPDVCKILVIDDLLLSLDMANRLCVIDMLLDYSTTFQTLILTHDRSFYQVTQNKIQERKQQAKWVMSQIYIKPSADANAIPEPVISNSKSGLHQAMDFYLNGQFEAAIVTLRKECEAHLKRIIPYINIIDEEKAYKKGQLKYQDLSKMIDALQPYFAKHHAADLSAPMPNIVPNLHTFRELLLNQAAHNDYETPRFTHEIELAFQEIEKLTQIEKYILIKHSKIMVDDYRFEITDAAGAAHSFTFRFANIFSVLSQGGTDYYLSTTIDEAGSQKRLADRITAFCGHHTSPVPADILQHITHTATGTILSDTLASLKA